MLSATALIDVLMTVLWKGDENRAEQSNLNKSWTTVIDIYRLLSGLFASKEKRDGIISSLNLHSMKKKMVSFGFPNRKERDKIKTKNRWDYQVS